MRFGSPEWVAAVVAALRAARIPDAAFTLQQIVTGSADGELRYWLSFEGTDVDGGTGDAPNTADITLTQDHDTAVALATGELNPQGAFMQGRLKITGDMGKLLKNQAVTDALGPAMGSVAAEYSV